MEPSYTPEVIFARHKIIGAAQKVLASKKVSGTRMREIARQAGISQGTLHYYFPSKTGLFLDLLDEMQRYFEMRQKQLLSHELDAAGKIRLFADQQQQLLQQNPQVEEIFLDFWGHAMVDAAIREKILSMYAAWRRDIRLALEQGVQAGEFDAGQAAVAPYLLVALLEGTALQYLPDPTALDSEQVFQAIQQIMLHWLQGDYAAPVGESQAADGRSRRRPYPSDISETRWTDIAPLLHPAKEGGRPRSTDLREIVNALLYQASCNCSWRMLPHDFPGWQTVYAYYRIWGGDGTLERMGAILGVDFSGKGRD